MKRITLAICTATFLFTACNNDKTADAKKEDSSMESKDKTPVDMCADVPKDTTMKMDSATMAMMDMMTKAAAPGDMHKMLAGDEGEWNGDVTFWADPAAPATKSKSTCTNKMIFDGRYQVSDHNGCMMGKPFRGMGLAAYDNAKKVFMNTWVDNMGTTVMTMEGPWDPVTKTIHLAGSCTNPMDGKPMNLREDFIYVDNDTRKMIMWGPDMTGKEYKTMEIVYTRKK